MKIKLIKFYELTHHAALIKYPAGNFKFSRKRNFYSTMIKKLLSVKKSLQDIQNCK